MSTLAEFLNENGIKPETLITNSRKTERRKDADRTLATKRSDARRIKKTYEELQLQKPKALGRGFSPSILQTALAGRPVSRLARKKIVRAVNESLVKAKKEPVDWRKLFAGVGARKQKKPEKK